MQTLPVAPGDMGQAIASPPTAPEPSLLPRPGRSLAWIVSNAALGTWFLIAAHVGAVAAFFTDPTWLDWALLPLFLLARGYATTIGYHRYFSHRAFKTSRVVQFLLAVLCCVNLQRGPIWWAAIHRHHHRHSDDEHDAHSPVTGSFLWSHCGWMFATLEQPDLSGVRDLLRYPELVWLERFWLLPALLVAGALYLIGGWSMVCVDFCISAVVVMHGAFATNSFGHVFGWQRYKTGESSRNSFVMGFLMLGDGWHNNHHHHPHSANHGFFWWEVDSSFRMIVLMEKLGLVWGVRRAPAHRVLKTAAAAANAAPAREADLVCSAQANP